MLDENISRFIPRYGPEWGSGGIFGLKYHKRTLYFTLAFEARSYFISGSEVKIYDFSKVGTPPCSGGDTYNAVTAIDDKIYFGGWVHVNTKQVYKNKSLRFVNKYSHIHSYDISEGSVNLLWKDGPGGEDTWVGEVSELIYDELNNRIFVARGDGHENMGVYSFDLDSKKMTRISEIPALKGNIFMDSIIFTKEELFFDGLQIFDIDTENLKVVELDELISGSRDGMPFDDVIRVIGNVGTCCNNVFVFMQGGVLVGDPLNTDAESSKMTFVRLFDFPNTNYSPFRVNVLPYRGGLLTAYNLLPDMLGRKIPELVAPSVLLYVSPPLVRIVGVFGGRITSLEKAGSKVLVASNTMPNTDKPIAIDNGCRDISFIEDSSFDRSSPPYYLSLKGSIVGNSVWGGIPLMGYKHRTLIIQSSKNNKLTIFEYDIVSPDTDNAVFENISIEEGKNIIDLSAFSGIVSFKFNNIDEKAQIKLELS
ncbi:MAG: DUF2139 domain-containing protein [Candidatus Asgardarchaeia archaeon]